MAERREGREEVSIGLRMSRVLGLPDDQSTWNEDDETRFLTENPTMVGVLKERIRNAKRGRYEVLTVEEYKRKYGS